jgi:hypothetical protein
VRSGRSALWLAGAVEGESRLNKGVIVLMGAEPALRHHSWMRAEAYLTDDGRLATSWTSSTAEAGVALCSPLRLREVMGEFYSKLKSADAPATSAQGGWDGH